MSGRAKLITARAHGDLTARLADKVFVSISSFFFRVVVTDTAAVSLAALPALPEDTDLPFGPLVYDVTGRIL